MKSVIFKTYTCKLDDDFPNDLKDLAEKTCQDNYNSPVTVLANEFIVAKAAAVDAETVVVLTDDDGMVVTDETNK